MYSLADNIQPVYYSDIDYTIQKAIFFSGNTDARWFLNFCNNSKHYDIPLINKNYYFLDVQPALEKSFSKVIDEEEYLDVIKHTAYLLCDDVEMCMQSLRAGNKPLFFMKRSKIATNMKAIYQNDIPIVEGKNLDELMRNYERSIKNYNTQVFYTYAI